MQIKNDFKILLTLGATNWFSYAETTDKVVIRRALLKFKPSSLGYNNK